MRVVVRRLEPGEEHVFLDIHTRSIKGLASQHYPPEVISAWILPATDESFRRLVDNRDREIRLIAEIDNEPVGLGAIVVDGSELRACYVVPEAARKGVGTALVKEMERIAKKNGLQQLDLLASVNAEEFYVTLGYESHERTEHTLASGQQMAAIRMSKKI